MLLDTHAHIVPQVDDGAKSMQESQALLNLLAEQQVSAVIATPHLSFRQTDPIAVRTKIQTAFNGLKAVLTEKQPALFLGYEVSYHRGISHNEEIVHCTLGGTDKILIELPMAHLTEEIANDIAELGYNFHLTPVLAHLERYAKCPGFEHILALIEEGDAKAQVVASSVLTHNERKTVEYLAKENYISYLGSDTHSVSRRPPLIDEFLKYAAKRCGDGFLKMLYENNLRLFGELSAKGQ